MSPTLASTITRTASTQTWSTIRFLVDRDRREDAYRAYAYFRWLDDVLDTAGVAGPIVMDSERLERRRLLERQRFLLDRCVRGEALPRTGPHEAMLVELLRDGPATDNGLLVYLRQMLLVMEFDVLRRGRLVSGAELDQYTGWLAAAVTEAMNTFIGHGAAAPHDETRYLAVSGAHVLHMLRDTFDDIRVGYYNIPREVLERHSIGPTAVYCDAYRGWVKERVELARADLDAGRSYFARVESRRHRLAGLAYIARFEWLVDAIQRDDYRLRSHYGHRPNLAAALGSASHLVSAMAGHPTASMSRLLPRDARRLLARDARRPT